MMGHMARRLVVGLAALLLGVLLGTAGPRAGGGVRADSAPTNEAFFFPEECQSSTGTCCPYSSGEECGGTARGHCESIASRGDDLCGTSDLQGAYLWWALDSFQTVCVCKAQYYGAACDECAPGWTGDDCSEKVSPVVRRDFASLSEADRDYVIQAFVLAKNTPHHYQPSVSEFDFLAAVHYWSMTATTKVNTTLHPELIGQVIGYGHGGPAAPVFHRRMVLEMERALRRVTQNSSFALPYWNWTGSAANDNEPTLLWFGGDGDPSGLAMIDGSLQACRTVPADAEGDPGPPDGCKCSVTRGAFAGWSLVGDWGVHEETNRTIERAFGCQTLYAPSLPTQDTADYIVANVSKYDLYFDTDYLANCFRNLLGGGSVVETSFTGSWPSEWFSHADMHKRAHRWVSGSMVGNYSASDPLFYMLHGYADVLLERWIRNAALSGTLTTNNSWPASGAVPGHNRNECVAPFFPLTRGIDLWRMSGSLGYTYDYFTVFENMHAAGLDVPVSTFTAMSEPEDFDVSDLTTATISSGSVPQGLAFLVHEDCDAANRLCCPESNGAVCGGDARGSCSEVVADSDSSLWWFTDAFDYACVCTGNWWGASCSECADGWTGSNCSEAMSSVRREFNTLSLSEKQQVVEAFALAKVTPHPHRSSVSMHDYMASLYQFAATGGASVRTSSSDDYAFNHGGPAFITWNRRFMLDYERLLRIATQNSSFTLPYWAWDQSLANNMDAALRWFGRDGDTVRNFPTTQCRSQASGCNCTLGEGSAFTDWSVMGLWANEVGVLTRAFSCLSGGLSLPAQSTTSYVLSLTAFVSSSEEVATTPSFSAALEGQVWPDVSDAVRTWPYTSSDMNARMMAWFGGTLGSSSGTDGGSPASDPLFYLAHAYTDLLAEKWLRAQLISSSATGTTLSTSVWDDSSITTTGHGRLQHTGGLYPLATNWQYLQRSDALGYSYDVIDSTSTTTTTSSSSLRVSVSSATPAVATAPGEASASASLLQSRVHSGSGKQSHQQRLRRLRHRKHQ